MTELEIEETLGAYALDAVDDDERAEIEEHLLICPRCRAEVAAHREVATLLGNGGAAAPDELWNRIASELSPEAPIMAFDSAKLTASIPAHQRNRKRRKAVFSGMAFAAAAAVVLIAMLFVQVGNLNNQIHPSNSSGTGVTAAVNSALAGSHRNIVLTSAVKGKNIMATVVIAPDGTAYWTGSNLPALPKNETYQLWTVSRGKTIVSLGVLGANPSSYTAFRLQSNMHQLMVTVEPKGGTSGPTSAVLVSALV